MYNPTLLIAAANRGRWFSAALASDKITVTWRDNGKTEIIAAQSTHAEIEKLWADAIKKRDKTYAELSKNLPKPGTPVSKLTADDRNAIGDMVAWVRASAQRAAQCCYWGFTTTVHDWHWFGADGLVAPHPDANGIAPIPPIEIETETDTETVEIDGEPVFVLRVWNRVN